MVFVVGKWCYQKSRIFNPQPRQAPERMRHLPTETKKKYEIRTMVLFIDMPGYREINGEINAHCTC
jgi:hypothetical protein